jgi:hypothetical protein
VDAELDAFKTQIDLRLYAAAQGYQLDPRESWRGSAVMRLGGRGGDKIIIKRNSNGHYVFFSVRDDADNGTIIDFIQKRQHLSLGGVRQALRPWIGRPPSPALPLFPAMEKVGKDRRQVERAFAAMDPDAERPYLTVTRGLPSGLTQVPRFRECARLDAHGNVMFPHFDEHGLCGFELKNRDFTGFAAGGDKGLWVSNESPRDRRLVFCESAIECLSHATLFPDLATRYASIGGKPNPRQPALITTAVTKMPASSAIVAAMNADPDGRALVEIVRVAFDRAALASRSFTVQEPTAHNDWNDALRSARHGMSDIPSPLVADI